MSLFSLFLKYVPFVCTLCHRARLPFQSTALLPAGGRVRPPSSNGLEVRFPECAQSATVAGRGAASGRGPVILAPLLLPRSARSTLFCLCGNGRVASLMSSFGDSVPVRPAGLAWFDVLACLLYPRRLRCLRCSRFARSSAVSSLPESGTWTTLR